ncbi:MAG: CHASE2 domain-containing protein [Phycisphaerales bacterium]
MAPAWVDRPYEDVVVVVIDEGMNEQGVVDGLCAKVGVESGSVAVKGSMRPLVWKVVQRIADPGTGCRGVGLDIVNEFRSEFDGSAAEAIGSIGEAWGEGGAPVVAAMPVAGWTVRDGRPVPKDLSGPIAHASAEAGVGVGAVTGMYEGDSYWSVDFMLKREGEGAIPTLPLALWARMQEREGDLVFVPGSPDQGGKVVVGKSAANPGGREMKLPRMPVEVVDRATAKEVFGVEEGMRVNTMLVAVPGKANRAKRTLRLADVAAACDGSAEGNSKLNKWFNRKVVIIGDERETRPDDQSLEPLTDIKDHPSGEQVPGVYAMATAVQWLLDGRSVKFPFGGRTWVWTGVLCAAGVMGVWWGLGRRRLKWVWSGVAVGVVGVVWVAGVAWAYWLDGWYVGPWVPLSGLVLAGVGAWGVWRVRTGAEGGGRGVGIGTLNIGCVR